MVPTLVTFSLQCLHCQKKSRSKISVLRRREGYWRPFWSEMIIPVRCFTCGKVIGNKWESWLYLLKTEGDNSERYVFILNVILLKSLCFFSKLWRQKHNIFAQNSCIVSNKCGYLTTQHSIRSAQAQAVLLSTYDINACRTNIPPA